MPLNPPSSEAKSLLSTKKERLHRMISQKISESATGLISSELLFALFKRFCKDEILLEKFSEFNESQVIPSFSTEDAILFVDQLLDFSASPLISSGPEESPAEEPPASEQPPQAVPVSKDAFVRQQETISEFHRQLEDVQHSLQRSKSINQSVRKENAEFQEEIFRLRKQLEAAGQTCQEPSAFLRDRIASLSASLEQRKGYVEQLETLISDVRADRVGSVPEKSIEQTLSRVISHCSHTKKHVTEPWPLLFIVERQCGHSPAEASRREGHNETHDRALFGLSKLHKEAV